MSERLRPNGNESGTGPSPRSDYGVRRPSDLQQPELWIRNRWVLELVEPDEDGTEGDALERVDQGDVTGKGLVSQGRWHWQCESSVTRRKRNTAGLAMGQPGPDLRSIYASIGWVVVKK